jgi:PAS domain S-box-containing protein
MGSTLTEFTKRRNWSQRVIEEIKDLLCALTPDARFLYLSPSIKFLTGYEASESTGKFIHDFIHGDDNSLFLLEINGRIATCHTLRMFYRFRCKSGAHTIFDCHGGHAGLNLACTFRRMGKIYKARKGNTQVGLVWIL